MPGEEKNRRTKRNGAMMRASRLLARTHPQPIIALPRHRSPGARFIVPEAAFVASTATVEAALRISEMEGTSSSARFVPLFVNFVGHDAVARPMVAPSARGAASTSDALVPVEEHQTWSGALGCSSSISQNFPLIPKRTK